MVTAQRPAKPDGRRPLCRRHTSRRLALAALPAASAARGEEVKDLRAFWPGGPKAGGPFQGPLGLSAVLRQQIVGTIYCYGEAAGRRPGAEGAIAGGDTARRAELAYTRRPFLKKMA